MPNILDINPLCALAKRASARISDEKIAKRFERIATDHLLKDPRNFRLAIDCDLTNAPRWACDAFERGEDVSVYKANRSLAVKIHAVARRVADTCKIAETDDTEAPSHMNAISAARRFLDKFGRVDFETAARKTLTFSQLLAGLTEDLDTQPVCADRTLVSLSGRSWTRLTSVAALRAVGREFNNCLARTTRAGGYGGMLRLEQVQFWVLRDAHGAGLIVAMATIKPPAYFTEVKGPSNKAIRSDHSDLLHLGAILGMRAPPPPPPPPSPPPSLVAALSLARSPCYCSLCVPSLRRRLRAH